MKYDMTYSEKPRMIVATLEGLSDVEGCLRAATEARKAADEKNCNVIYDVRPTQFNFSTVDWYEWPRNIAAQNVGLPSKLAVLCRERSDFISFFETAAQNAGQNVRVFTDYDEAVQWVAVTRPEDPTRNQREESPSG